MASQTIQVRRGLSTEWSTINPILSPGELGFETDTGKIKVGAHKAAINPLTGKADLPTNWSDLGYIADIKDGAITDSQISSTAAIANSKLANSAVTINGTSVPLGGSYTLTATAKFTMSDTVPPAPSNGDVWWYSVDGTLFTYFNDGTSSQWVEATKKSNVDSLSYQTYNAVINGGMDISQRGSSFIPNTVTAYSLDRWAITSDASTGNTVEWDSADVPTGLRYAAKITTGSASSRVRFKQAIENANIESFQGMTVTLSAYVKLTSFSGNLTANVNYSTTTDALSSLTTALVTGSAIAGSATTAWTRVQFSFAVPSNTFGLSFDFIPDSAQAIGSITRISGVQLEAGAVATPFHRNAPSIQAELAACQRYYYRNTSTANNTRFSYGLQTSSTGAEAIVYLPVELRVVPTAVESSAILWTDGSTFNATISSASIYQVGTTKTIQVAVVFPTNGAVRYPGYIAAVSSGAYIGFSAEL